MAIDNVRLPVNVEQGATGGPRFQTSIQTALSGIEQRIAEWDVARCEYDISYGIRTKSDLLQVIKLFRARQGPAFPFRFKDWGDFEAENVDLGTGDGVTATYQLVKTYDDDVVEVTRTIQLPVNGTVEISVAGVLKTETTHYGVNYSTGLITFVGGSIPTGGQAVTATFEFDVPVRFAEDKLNISVEFSDEDGEYLLGEIPDVPLLEVLNE